MDPSTERFQLQMAVLHQSMCISKAGHSILRHVRVEYKDKKRMECVMCGVWCNSRLPLPKFKDLCVRSRCGKNNQDEWMYVTPIVKLWNFSGRFQLNYEILLPVLNTFTGDTEDYFLDV